MISENILTLNENILLSKEMLSTRLIEKGVEASKTEGLFSLINKVSLIPTGAMLQEKTFTENGTFLPDEGFDGFNKVIISVPTSGADGTYWKLNENKYIINSEGEKMCAEELYYGSTNTGVSRQSNVPYSKETTYEDYLYYNVYDMIGKTELFGGSYLHSKYMVVNGELMDLETPFTPPTYGLYEVGILKDYENETYFKYMTFNKNTRIKECVVNTSKQTPDSLYSGCTNLEKATIIDCKNMQNNEHYISSNMFVNCTKLKDVIISNNIKGINSGDFSGCTSLTSVTIGNSVTSIGGNAFQGCSSIENINLPDSLTYIDKYAFYDCTSLTSIIIPNSVTTINRGAFLGCSSLSGSFTFPTGVTIVTDSVLKNTNVSRVIIHNVESIGSAAFENCSKLVRIDCYSPVAPTLGASCFSGIPDSGIVNVPKDSDYSTWQEVLPNCEFRYVL